MIESYKLLYGRTPEELNKRVATHLMAGFQPYGFPLVGEYYVQAMTFDPSSQKNGKNASTV